MVRAAARPGTSPHIAVFLSHVLGGSPRALRTLAFYPGSRQPIHSDGPYMRRSSPCTNLVPSGFPLEASTPTPARQPATRARRMRPSGREDHAAMHFRAPSPVGEPVRDPYAYLANDVSGTLHLLQAMRRHGIDRGARRPVRPAGADLIGESRPIVPSNPYGASKRVVETIAYATIATDDARWRSITSTPPAPWPAQASPSRTTGDETGSERAAGGARRVP